MKAYTPPEQILQKYADLLVNFGLNGGDGIRPAETVCLQIPESARPLLNPLITSVLRAKAIPFVHYLPEGFDRWESVNRTFYEEATIEQLQYMPKHYLLGRIKDADHYIPIKATNDPLGLQGIPKEKITARNEAVRFYKEARNAKEERGKFSWTMANYGTPAMAAEASLSPEQYWEQIIKGCYLDDDDPLERWREMQQRISELQQKMNKLQIQALHLRGEDIELTVQIGKKRQWLGGSGRNIPSFEIFTSPDWRGTEGWFRATLPLYYAGNKIPGIYLRFAEGRVVEATAEDNEEILQALLETTNADKMGEISLTDNRLSRIDKFMADTLFDENHGGQWGNTHLALGDTYHDAYLGDQVALSKKDWAQLGFNSSPVHRDIVSTSDREVTAQLSTGEKKVIYREGKFLL